MAVVYHSTSELETSVLSHASSGEMLAMSQIFRPNTISALSPKDLVSSICETGGHAVGNWLRGQGVAYSELLHDVAVLLNVDGLEHLNVVTSNGLTLAEMDARASNPVLLPDVATGCKKAVKNYVQHTEFAVLKKFAEDAYSRMSPEQRLEVDREIQTLLRNSPGSSNVGIGTTAAFLAAASATGFAPYLLLSTVISTVTAGTASFGVYTAASSALHVLLGPVGWTALGAAAVYKVGGPNKQKCLKSVLAIALLRGRLNGQVVERIPLW